MMVSRVGRGVVEGGAAIETCTDLTELKSIHNKLGIHNNPVENFVYGAMVAVTGAQAQA